jgi:hypothetical protein
MTNKIILHLCADIGSDSRYYDLDSNYNVIRVGKEIGVENYKPPEGVHGIIANPVCTEFSTVSGFDKRGNLTKGMFLVDHCMRIIRESNCSWWLMENPAKGRLKEVIGKYQYSYQPWHYGSPWTKLTGLWGNFNMPSRLYSSWNDVPKNTKLYKRPNRAKPSLAYLHKSAIKDMPEFSWAKDKILHDSDIRSMCSNGFAREFYLANP